MHRVANFTEQIAAASRARNGALNLETSGNDDTLAGAGASDTIRGRV